jgi:hypothetical protein
MASVAFALSPGSAMAGVSGQVGDAWGPPAELAGKELIDPSTVAMDPSDGSVFVAANDGGFTETVIRKFSDTGHFEGSVSLPGRTYVGLAVDPARGRLYILEGVKVGATKEATKILIYSTTPTGEALVPDETKELPVPTGSEALHGPQEIVVDPSTGDVVVVATEVKEEKAFTTLQRIDVDPITGVGAVGERFVEEEESATVLPHAIAIDKSGVTYVLADRTVLGNPTLTAESLPARFSASSSLTPVPGFAAQNAAPSSITLPTRPGLPNRGPQVAVTTSANGEDTLYWKEEIANADEFLVEGYSVDGENRTSVFGGGTEEAECRISTSTTALQGDEDGDLAVFDQGTLVAAAGESPQFHPVAYQFGPGGSGCPAPAPGFKLEAGGHTVSSVPSGSTVAFDGTETETNEAPAIEGVTWKVEGPEEFTEAITGSTLTFSHKFVAPGDYTVRMTIKAEAKNSAGGGLGSTFSAQPQTLEVTAGGTLPEDPTITSVSPDEGPTTGGTVVTISGTKLTGATEVKFGTVAVQCTEEVTTCKVESDTEIKATTPALTAGTVDVHAVTGTGESSTSAPADHFTAVAPVTAKFTLTVGKAGSGTGSVTSSPAGINCGAACSATFNANTSVTLTESASSGSTFVGWEGACSGTAGSCVVPMSAAKTVTATFNANPPATENKPPLTESKPPVEVKPPPVEAHPGPGPKPKTKAEILAAQRKAALKKCQKLKGKGKAMCVKKANQIGKPKKKTTKKPKA